MQVICSAAQSAAMLHDTRKTLFTTFAHAYLPKNNLY